MQSLPDVRLRHLARQIHILGERPLFELLKELDHGAALPDALERFASLVHFAGFISAQGGGRIPQPRLVGEHQ